MDSSINTAKPYKEKTFRSKLPVRKPRAKKTPEPTTTSLITLAERQAIRASQAKLIKETEEASATAIQQAIRSNLARKAVKNARASKAMNTAGDVLSASKLQRAMRSKIARTTMAKMKAEGDAITVPVPKTKRAKKEKPVYKISYAAALKEWNMGHNRAMWCNPRVGTDDHKAVIALRL